MTGADPAGALAAGRRWAQDLARWSIPEHILRAAPRSPWGFDVSTFGAAADAALARSEDTPSDAAARAALPNGGSVLDVGAGAGAAGLRLHEAAGLITAVDTSEELLAEFTRRAERLGLRHRSVVGRWPDSVDAVEPADVVVCHHVLYNVPDLVEFASALDARALLKVVIELPEVHPLTWLAPLWRELHGLERPARPTGEQALAVLRALGLDVEVVRWRRPYAQPERSGLSTERIARWLCLGPERLDELSAALQRHPPPDGRDVLTLCWAPSGTAPGRSG